MKIYLSAAIVLVLGFGLWRASKTDNPMVAQPQLDATQGDSVCRPDGGKWNASGGSAVIIASLATCGACQKQLPLDEEVFQMCLKHQIPVYYLLGFDSKNDERARELKGLGRAVIRTSLAAAGLQHIPTIARLNASGVIESSWTGSVPAGRHDEILASILSGTSLQKYQRISESELRGFVSRHKVQVVAFSEIGKDPSISSLIVRPEEFYIRAKHEIDRDLPVLIDCGSALSPRVCQDAVLDLTAQAPREVIVAGMPHRTLKCP